MSKVVIPQKIAEYFNQNENKSKKDIIKEVMEIFNYKKTTALSYYSNRHSNLITKKEIVFKFFDNNPDALNDIDNKKYAEKLGVAEATYTEYKSKYKVLYPIEVKKELSECIKELDKYYKGRLRQKFEIDDSKLFG